MRISTEGSFLVGVDGGSNVAHTVKLLLFLTSFASLNGCTVAASDSALATALRRPMTAHAAALAGEDVAAMRRTGRNVIAIYDAGVGR